MRVSNNSADEWSKLNDQLWNDHLQRDQKTNTVRWCCVCQTSTRMSKHREGLRRRWGLDHFDDILFHLLARQWPRVVVRDLEIKYAWVCNEMLFPTHVRRDLGVFRVPGPLASPLSACCSSHSALATWGGCYQGDHPHQRDPCVPTPQMGSVRQPPGGSRTGLGPGCAQVQPQVKRGSLLLQLIP